MIEIVDKSVDKVDNFEKPLEFPKKMSVDKNIPKIWCLLINYQKMVYHNFYLQGVEKDIHTIQNGENTDKYWKK